MVAVYINGRPTGLAFSGRRAMRQAMRVARDLARLMHAEAYPVRLS